MGVDFTIAQLLFPWCQESQNKKCPAWIMDDTLRGQFLWGLGVFVFSSTFSMRLCCFIRSALMSCTSTFVAIFSFISCCPAARASMPVLIWLITFFTVCTSVLIGSNCSLSFV